MMLFAGYQIRSDGDSVPLFARDWKRDRFATGWLRFDESVPTVEEICSDGW
jgi:hypothetical protein